VALFIGAVWWSRRESNPIPESHVEPHDPAKPHEMRGAAYTMGSLSHYAAHRFRPLVDTFTPWTWYQVRQRETAFTWAHSP